MNTYITMKKHKEFFNIIWSKHRQNANKNNHFKRQPTGKTTRQGHKVNSIFVLHISDVLNITAQISIFAFLDLLAVKFIDTFALISARLSCCYATAFMCVTNTAYSWFTEMF